MIRVLSVVSELNVGGGENRLLNLARSIDDKRFQHTVATIFARAEGHPCSSMQWQFEKAGVRLIPLAVPHPASVRASGVQKAASTAASLATAVKRLREVIADLRIDVVDAHLETALYTAAPAAASLRVPVTATLYSELDLWRAYDAQIHRRLIMPPFRRTALRLCDAIFTDSDARARDLAAYAGQGPAIFVVPNGVRLDPPSASREELRRALGIPDGAIVLGQVAGLVPFKGQSVLLDAAAALGRDVFVLCVGDGRNGPAYPDKLRAQAERLGVRARIGPYAGNIADMWSVIDVHVHCSSIDSLPNAILEGMSLGKPAVLSAVGAVPDHAVDGETALLVPPDDPIATAAALRRILDDAALAERLGRGAHAQYLERFTPEVTTRRVEECFERVLAARRRAA